MKILLGVMLGLGLAIGGYALAAAGGVSGLQIVDELHKVGYFGLVIKVYDKDTNVVCYTFQGGSSGYAISCLKNI